jgi:hypothetical protein
MRNLTRSLLAAGVCTFAVMSSAAVAAADATVPPDSEIVADTGVVLDETVETAETAAGEQTCTDPQLFNPLQAFNDKRDYFLAPAGSFEDQTLPGWKLEGGARVSAGSAPYGVTGPGHSSSLALPPGSSATSPEMCVDLSYPTFRFFVAQLVEDSDAELAVDVIYPALEDKNVREAKKLKLKPKDGWKLSDDVKLEPQRLGKKEGWRKVALRFRAKPGKKNGEFRIDDILIDPRRCG